MKKKKKWKAAEVGLLAPSCSQGKHAVEFVIAIVRDKGVVFKIILRPLIEDLK